MYRVFSRLLPKDYLNTSQTRITIGAEIKVLQPPTETLGEVQFSDNRTYLKV